MSSELPKDTVLDILTNESSDSEIEVKPKTEKVDKRTLAKNGIEARNRLKRVRR